ncbi:MAG: N-acetylmuramoyl-L-alanine amidase [Oscillospiraceae bacterium]|nr:N-acetylmuramoyl-L-alanine amidase [Oscillospiraceae bacterium]
MRNGKGVGKIFLAAILIVALLLAAGPGRRSKQAVSTVYPVRMPERQLILDAGHGGEDGGAVSITGVAESTINLAITLKIDQILGFYGVCPILLRDADISLHDAGADTLRKKKVSDLKSRVSTIESVENGVLISVHQNTFTNPIYHGAQVFYRDTKESLALAELTQETLRQGLDVDNDRVPTKIPDSVYLMKHISCTAILIECGFLSNPTEEEKLRSGSYQTQLAVCIASAWLQSKEIQGGNPSAPVL